MRKSRKKRDMMFDAKSYGIAITGSNREGFLNSDITIRKSGKRFDEYRQNTRAGEGICAQGKFNAFSRRNRFSPEFLDAYLKIENHRVLVIGPRGGGKTHFLFDLWRHLLEEETAIPLYVDLAFFELTQEANRIDFIRQFISWSFSDTNVEISDSERDPDKKYVLLLDNLDRSGIDSGLLVSEINILEKLKNLKIVLVSRDDHSLFDQFKSWECMDLEGTFNYIDNATGKLDIEYIEPIVYDLMNESIFTKSKNPSSILLPKNETKLQKTLTYAADYLGRFFKSAEKQFNDPIFELLEEIALEMVKTKKWIIKSLDINKLASQMERFKSWVEKGRVEVKLLSQHLFVTMDNNHWYFNSSVIQYWLAAFALKRRLEDGIKAGVFPDIKEKLDNTFLSMAGFATGDHHHFSTGKKEFPHSWKKSVLERCLDSIRGKKFGKDDFTVWNLVKMLRYTRINYSSLLKISSWREYQKYVYIPLFVEIQREYEVMSHMEYRSLYCDFSHMDFSRIDLRNVPLNGAIYSTGEEKARFTDAIIRTGNFFPQALTRFGSKEDSKFFNKIIWSSDTEFFVVNRNHRIIRFDYKKQLITGCWIYDQDKIYYVNDSGEKLIFHDSAIIAIDNKTDFKLLPAGSEKYLYGVKEAARNFAYTADNKRSLDFISHKIREKDLATDKIIWEYNCSYKDARFMYALNDKRIIINTSKTALRIFDADTKEELHVFMSPRDIDTIFASGSEEELYIFHKVSGKTVLSKLNVQEGSFENFDVINTTMRKTDFCVEPVSFDISRDGKFGLIAFDNGWFVEIDLVHKLLIRSGTVRGIGLRGGKYLFYTPDTSSIIAATFDKNKLIEIDRSTHSMINDFNNYNLPFEWLPDKDDQFKMTCSDGIERRVLKKTVINTGNYKMAEEWLGGCYYYSKGGKGISMSRYCPEDSNDSEIYYNYWDSDRKAAENVNSDKKVDKSIFKPERYEGFAIGNELRCGLFNGGQRRTIYEFDLESDKDIGFYTGHNSEILDAKYSKDDKFIISVDVNSEVLLYRRGESDPIYSFKLKTERAVSVGFTDTEFEIYVITKTSVVYIQMDKKKIRRRYPILGLGIANVRLDFDYNWSEVRKEELAALVLNGGDKENVNLEIIKRDNSYASGIIPWNR